MSTIKVVVLLATYNGEKYLHAFLESLVAQTFKEFELIVRDDGSSDETLSIVNSYSNKLNITVSNDFNRLGAARNFIRLLTECSTKYEYYFFADQDDCWNTNKINRAVEKLSSKKNLPTLYCSGLELVGSNLSHISFSSAPRFISVKNALVENIATGCTMAFNSKARSLIVENLPQKISMHDWWIYIVISALGEVIYDDFSSVKYRQHCGNTIGAATSAYQDLVRRSKRFFSKTRSGVFGIAEQAAELYRCFGPLLSKQDIKLIESLTLGKNTVLGKFRLIFTSGFVRQKYLDTAILRTLFLIGRY